MISFTLVQFQKHLQMKKSKSVDLQLKVSNKEDKILEKGENAGY